MNMKKFFASALVALMGLPMYAQTAENVRINGSLIDWYYYGRDYTGGTSGESWNQQSTGGGAWIDENGVAHATGAPNYGLFSLIVPGQNRAMDPEFLIRNHILFSNCGGVYVGGNTYYSFFGHEVDASSNIEGEYGSEEYEILVRKWTWDGVDEATGLYKNVTYQQVGKLSNQPTDLTYDPLNDIVYGVFSIGDGGYKLGTLDMETFKVSWISREAMPLTGELRTLACNSKGELYGTDKSGNIYQVSTTDGKLTTVGNLGFQSQQRMMSATFDYRTDKMYWLGYINNGKSTNATDGTNTTLSVADGGRDTGLYEITFENGKANVKEVGKTNFTDVDLSDPENPVINKYGKMEMTGIYVDGSIVKHDNDLRAYFKSAPLQLKVGEAAKATVAVKNIGLADVRGQKYSVKFYVNGVETAVVDANGDKVYTDNLKAGESQEFTFDFTAPAAAGDYKLKVEAVFADDQQQNNNSAEADLRVLSDQLTATVKLEGQLNGNGLSLSWEDPAGRIVDGAEDYIAFTYKDLGAWTMYDGDKGYTQRPNSYNSAIDYPNWSTPKAFIVMDPVKAGFEYVVGSEKWMPYAGKQYFAGFNVAVPDESEAGGHQIPNDDWMISPELSGKAQTISFWAKGYIGAEAVGQVTTMDHVENIEVLYSTTGTDVQSFQVCKEKFQVNNRAWTQYTAELPEGAKHFAIRYCSEEGFVVMLDDIEYCIESREVKGYKLFCDGEQVAELGADVKTYNVVRAPEAAVYTVKAIYDDGTESNASNGVSRGVLLSIDNTPFVQPAAVDGIYNMRGMRVDKAQKGIYIVKQGNTVRKIVVR